MGLFDAFRRHSASGGQTVGIPPYPPVDEQRIFSVLKEEADEAFKRLFTTGPYIYQYQTEEEENAVYADYQDLSVEDLRVKAEAGDPKAQYLYGMHWTKQGEQYNTQARLWFKKSADAGNAEGALYSGFSYESGLGGEQDIFTAIKYYEQAAAGGHGAYASELLYNIYIDLTDDQDNTKVEDLERKLYWALSTAWYYQDEPEEGPHLYLVSALILNLLVMLGNCASFDLGMEHVDEFIQNSEQEKLHFDYALMGLQCLKTALEGGAREELAPGEKPLEEADFLCSIGEYALKFKRPYALDVLQMAIARGSDDAVVASAEDRIKIVISEALDRDARERDTLWGSYYTRAQRSYQYAVRMGMKREQAHALTALFLFQWYGVGCPENRESAIQSLQSAAALRYPRAAEYLNRIVRTPDGELMMR